MQPKIQKLFELANHYPSPHNGQPIEVVQIGDGRFEIYFHKERGLQAAEVSLLFSYVTMGVFMHHLSLSAQALGHKLEYTATLPSVQDIVGRGTIAFATCTVLFDTQTPNDILYQTLLFRQTSRKKYSSGVDAQLAQRTIDIANRKAMKLVQMNRADTRQAIWLNQRAVFDDMFDDAVRKELDHWLRYSKQQKEAMRDGLSYDCMELNGRAMKFITKHYKILRMPGIGTLLKNYYLRTMKDNSDAFYLLTPFSTEQEAFNVGVTVMKIWHEIAAEGNYLHPFGTIMSNEAAHADFLKLAGISVENKAENFLVFIYRAGKSAQPNSSLRIPVTEHLLRSQNV